MMAKRASVAVSCVAACKTLVGDRLSSWALELPWACPEGPPMKDLDELANLANETGMSCVAMLPWAFSQRIEATTRKTQGVPIHVG